MLNLKKIKKQFQECILSYWKEKNYFSSMEQGISCLYEEKDAKVTQMLT